MMDSKGLRYLSLFTGAGGGDLAMQHLVGMECVGYVEIEDYCQRVIAQRIKDGVLDNAPIFTDIRAFIDSGCAELYRGVADVAIGGFPCQPFSVAGKRRGEQDDRNLWPATIGVIQLVRPRYAFLENVPGLLSSGYFTRVLGDLAESGYNARWKVISAAELGAPHKRDRLWIVAHPVSQGSSSKRCGGETCKGGEVRLSCESSPLVHPSGAGLAQREGQQRNDGEKLQTLERASWWSAEPDVGRVAHGVAHRVDRLKALGNGQVPAVAAAAWEILGTI